MTGTDPCLKVCEGFILKCSDCVEDVDVALIVLASLYRTGKLGRLLGPCAYPTLAQLLRPATSTGELEK